MPCCCCGKSTPRHVHWCINCFTDYVEFLQEAEYCMCGRPIKNANRFWLASTQPEIRLSALCEECFEKLSETYTTVNFKDGNDDILLR